MASKYRYFGNVAEPANGTLGTAFPASGCDDDSSPEYGAWLFQPDGSEDAYYCDPTSELVAA